MKVAEFQKFIHSMGEVMRASGASGVGKELGELAGALDPYKDETLLGLRDVLNRARESPVAAGGVGRRPKKAAPPDEAKIRAALVRLQQLHARALDPTLTREGVAAVVKPYEKEMSGDELAELAKRFGIHKRPGSKPKTVAAIIERIVREQGSYARARE